MNLTFLIVGLGSMGKRRIRNLHINKEEKIIGFDIRIDRRKEADTKYNIQTIDDLKTLSADDFDVIIISTSPEAHGDYIRFALEHKKHFFVEHPTTDDGYEDIFEHNNLDIIKVPSCTFLFYEPIKMIKKILDKDVIGKILAFQYHMGQYLPDWHPWEDYREVYFSNKETSACREMLPFELIWLNWLMRSQVEDISGTITKVSNLDMDAEDIALATLKYKNGIYGNVIIDVISRKPFRTLRILGSNGVLEWERFEHTIRLYDATKKTSSLLPVPKGNPETGYINEEEMYNDEIKSFLDAIYGKAPYPHTFEENLFNLKALFHLIET
jgi:predicted dehydrogenase